MQNGSFILTVQLENDSGTTIAQFAGREAWALFQLIKAGNNGCTPIDQPAPRWSAYIHLLRKRGIAIETIYELHGGPFAGCHARYVLRDSVQVIDLNGAGEADHG